MVERHGCYAWHRTTTQRVQSCVAMHSQSARMRQIQGPPLGSLHGKCIGQLARVLVLEASQAPAQPS